MIRTCGSASSGITSGFGLAIAKTIGSSFIFPSASAGMIPGPERPMNRSMPSITLGGLAGQALGVGDLRVPALHVRHAAVLVVGALGGDRAHAVAADHVGDPRLEHHLGHRDPGCPEADHEDPQRLDRLADDLQRVEERRHHDDRGAVLVVVEDRDVERLLEPVLDLEAARRGDVLEVDAAEGRRHELDGLHDLVGVLGVEADREGVDAGELLEQHRLALHHRHRRLGADVAEAEDRRAVGDHGDRVALDRVLEGLRAVGVDLLADAGDARRVGHREVVAGLQRVLVALLDLAAAVHLHRAVRVLEHLGAPGRADRAQDLLPVLPVAGVDRELAHSLALGAGAGHQVDSLQRPAGLGDRSGQLAERLLASVELDADRDAVLGLDGAHAIVLGWTLAGMGAAIVRRRGSPPWARHRSPR